MNGRVASANSVASDPIREVDECSEPCGSHGDAFRTRLRARTDRSEGVRKVIMLEHLNPTPEKAGWVVVLGAYGCVGGICARLLVARGVAVLPLDKDDIDLMASGAAEQLQTRLAPDDAILVVSARAPCKDTGNDGRQHPYHAC